MSRLSTIMFILAGVAVLASIWLVAMWWQFLATAVVLGFAGVSLSVAADNKHKRDMDRARNVAGLNIAPGTIQIRTPDRPTRTQAQIDAELAEIIKHEGGHQ